LTDKENMVLGAMSLASSQGQSHSSCLHHAAPTHLQLCAVPRPAPSFRGAPLRGAAYGKVPRGPKACGQAGATEGVRAGRELRGLGALGVWRLGSSGMAPSATLLVSGLPLWWSLGFPLVQAQGVPSGISECSTSCPPGYPGGAAPMLYHVISMSPQPALRGQGCSDQHPPPLDTDRLGVGAPTSSMSPQPRRGANVARTRFHDMSAGAPIARVSGAVCPGGCWQGLGLSGHPMSRPSGS
jgi:hypothetical protein